MKPFPYVLAAMTACAGLAAPVNAQNFAQDPAQSTVSAPASLENDTEQLAEALYSTHLDDGSWTRHDAEACAPLAHHRFSLFTQAPTNGAIARFFAVYDLNPTPSHAAKPWHRGVLLIRLHPLPAKGLFSGPEDPILLAVFNRVLQDEHAAGRGVPPTARIDVDDLADCFLKAIDEQRAPVKPSEMPEFSKVPQSPVAGGRVIGKMISLVSPAGYTRTANFRFDDDGLLTTADILVQYTAR